MTGKYSLEWEAGHVVILKDGYLVGDFYPWFEEMLDELEDEELSEAELDEVLAEHPIAGGTLEVVAVDFPRHFVEDLFEEGDGLDKLEEVLRSYLEETEAWKRFCEENPEVKVRSDGFINFVAEVDIDFGEPVSTVSELKEKLAPWLDKLLSVG